MSASLYFFKYLTEKDRVAAACVCKVSQCLSRSLVFGQTPATDTPVGMERHCKAPFLVGQAGLAKLPASQQKASNPV